MTGQRGRFGDTAFSDNPTNEELAGFLALARKPSDALGNQLTLDQAKMLLAQLIEHTQQERAKRR